MKLFWLLCAGLLLAGTVEAGGEIGEDRWWHHINPPKSMLGTTGNELFLCDIGKPCKASYEAVGCYQRMREAMQAMDPYTGGWWSNSAINAVMRSRGESLREAADAADREDKIRAQWQAVMKECVQ